LEDRRTKENLSHRLTQTFTDTLGINMSTRSREADKPFGSTPFDLTPFDQLRVARATEKEEGVFDSLISDL
jgi:hypothetical protein